SVMRNSVVKKSAMERTAMKSPNALICPRRGFVADGCSFAAGADDGERDGVADVVVQAEPDVEGIGGDVGFFAVDGNHEIVLLQARGLGGAVGDEGFDQHVARSDAQLLPVGGGGREREEAGAAADVSLRDGSPPAQGGFAPAVG